MSSTKLWTTQTKTILGICADFNVTIRFRKLRTQYELLVQHCILHFHCLCFAHFKEFLSNPALKITIGLAQKIPCIMYKIFSDQCSLYLGSHHSVWSWAPGRRKRSRKLRRPSLQSWESLLEEWLPIICRGETREFYKYVFYFLFLMLSAAQSMGIATLGLIGKVEPTSEIATGSAMVFPCLQML